jgi:hypothetical protein
VSPSAQILIRHRPEAEGAAKSVIAKITSLDIRNCAARLCGRTAVSHHVAITHASRRRVFMSGTRLVSGAQPDEVTSLGRSE